MVSLKNGRDRDEGILLEYGKKCVRNRYPYVVISGGLDVRKDILFPLIWYNMYVSSSG